MTTTTAAAEGRMNRIIERSTLSIVMISFWRVLLWMTVSLSLPSSSSSSSTRLASAFQVTSERMSRLRRKTRKNNAISSPRISSTTKSTSNLFQSSSSPSADAADAPPDRAVGMMPQTAVGQSSSLSSFDSDALLLSPPSPSSTSSSSSSFISQTPQQVYIEDTDAYGIVLNSNYIKFYERALLSFATATTMMTEDDPMNEDGNFNTTTNNNNVITMIVGFQQQKFRSSPKLGDEYVIRGRRRPRQGCENASHTAIWDLEMTSPDGSIVYNTLSGAVVSCDGLSSSSSFNDFSVPWSTEVVGPTSTPSSSSKYDFTVWRDELDCMISGDNNSYPPRYVLPLHTTLNYFERPRSNLIGGPNELKRLQDQDGVVFVVTSIEDCYLSNNVETSGCPIYPGRQVQVDTWYDVKRNGMIVDCYQTLSLLVPPQTDVECSSSSTTDWFTNIVLAQGKVTVMMIDATTRRPTKRLPSWLKANLRLDVELEIDERT